MAASIRIYNKGAVGQYTKVYYVDREGNEIEISDVVREIGVNLKPGNIVDVKLRVICDEIDVLGELEETSTICPECGNDPVKFQHEKTCSRSWTTEDGFYPKDGERGDILG